MPTAIRFAFAVTIPNRVCEPVPTLFVMEGGYIVDEIGINAVNVLLGFEGET